MNYIIRSHEIEAMEGLAKTHFLNENAKRTNKSLGDVVGLKNLGFHIIEVLPGYESTEYHVHYSEDECVYILSGKATLTHSHGKTRRWDSGFRQRLHPVDD